MPSVFPLPSRSRGRDGSMPGLLLCLLVAACATTPSTKPASAVFYPAPPDPPRVQFLRSVTYDSDIEPGQTSLDALLFGEQELRRGVMAPYGAAVRDGIVYVCDIQQGVVLTLDFPQQKLDFLRLEGRDQLQKPSNLAFAPDGTLYIADMGRRQVVVLKPDLSSGTALGPFGDESRPTDVAVKGDRLFIVDAGSQCLRILDRMDGSELKVLGTDDPLLRKPTNVEIDDKGFIYVVDSIDCRVFIWEPDGKFSRTIGSPGDTVGQFARPKGIALQDDLVFVVDAAFENCQILNSAGEPLMFFGGSGSGPGSMYLPAGVWIGTEGLELFADEIEDGFHAQSLIIVTNQFGPNKVNFYAFGEPGG